jgi:hypothetical protein
METQKRYLENQLIEWSHPYKLLWHDTETIENKKTEIKNKLKTLI